MSLAELIIAKRADWIRTRSTLENQKKNIDQKLRVLNSDILEAEEYLRERGGLSEAEREVIEQERVAGEEAEDTPEEAAGPSLQISCKSCFWVREYPSGTEPAIAKCSLCASPHVSVKNIYQRRKTC